jgi:hypothetical protein
LPTAIFTKYGLEAFILINMKKKLFFTLLLASSVTLFAQEQCNCNYIVSGYYTALYRADIEYLRENKDKMFEYLQAAENKCPMLNMLTFYEVERYIPLLLERDSLQKSLYYINFLISEQGYQLDEFSDFSCFYKLQNLNNWDSIERNLLNIEKNFVSDTIFAMKFNAMQYRDQRYRSKNYLDFLKTIDDTIIRNEYGKKMKLADDSNFNDLIDLIKQYGFPTSGRVKMNITDQSLVMSSLTLMLVHFGTDSIKLKIIEPIMLDAIAKGWLLPDSYSNMIDRICFYVHQPFIYGSFMNISDNEIFDFEHLDERREKIGLLPYSLEKERRKLQLDFYK